MSVDIARIGEQVNVFWDEFGYAVVLSTGLLLLAVATVLVTKLIRSPQRDRWVAGLTALVVLAWTSEGLWEVAYFTLGLPLAFSIMTFFVYEAMMLTSAMQAEQHRKRRGTPGPAGRYVWVLALVTASIVALNAATLVEALLRFTLPLAAAGLWWVSIAAEHDDEPNDVRARRQAEAARREAAWAIGPRAILVALGIMRPGNQSMTEAERRRRIRQMVIAADRLHAARAGSWRARRASVRLRRLARSASAGEINEVRARVERTTQIAELVLPHGEPSPASPVPAEAPSPAAPSTGQAEVKVPGTGWRIRQWIDTWMRMCADGHLVLGPITDDQHARDVYGVSAKHLNNVRKAAVSGALRRRAYELGVPLPAGFVDDLSPQRLNGKTPATV